MDDLETEPPSYKELAGEWWRWWCDVSSGWQIWHLYLLSSVVFSADYLINGSGIPFVPDPLVLPSWLFLGLFSLYQVVRGWQ